MSDDLAKNKTRTILLNDLDDKLSIRAEAADLSIKSSTNLCSRRSPIASTMAGDKCFEVQSSLSSSTESLGFSLNNLGEDILIEILLRFPTAEFVNLCKVVCKSWYFITSDLYFIRRFVSHHIIKHHSEYRGDNDVSSAILSYQNPQYQEEAVFVSSEHPHLRSGRFMFSYLPEEEGTVGILGSFNDLLLCGVRQRDYIKCYICNPFTMQWVAIPSPSNGHQGYSMFGFICEPFYCRATDEEYVVNIDYRYRVVCITDVGNDSLTVANYCSETGNWDGSVLLGAQYNFNYSNIVPHNGKLHWYNGVDIVAYDPFNGGEICFVDGALFKPTGETDPWLIYSYCLGVCRGFLRMMKVATEAEGHRFRPDTLSIWELKDYETGKWNLEHKIPFNAFVSESSCVKKYLKNIGFCAEALAFHPTNNSIAYLGFEGRIISCDLQRKELSVAAEIPHDNNFHYCDNMFQILVPWWPTPVF